MNTCCPTLERLIFNAGEKGFSAIPLNSGDLLFFLLQFRSNGFSGEDNITRIGDIGIKYCPFCGTKLAKVIKANKEYFVQLAEKNKDLIH